MMLSLSWLLVLLTVTLALTVNEEMSPLLLISEMNMRLDRSERVEWPIELDLDDFRSRIYETDILRLANCPCIEQFGGEGARTSGNLSRFYVFDTAGEIPSGLNHQMSNLRGILAEGLSLGRAVLLRRPSLTVSHNFDKQFRFNMWGDFISMNRSQFTLTHTQSGQQEQSKMCSGFMADCIADVSERQLRDLLHGPHSFKSYHNGSVSLEMNAKPGLLVRAPEPGIRDKVTLIRKLPEFPDLLYHYNLRYNIVAPNHIKEAVPPVVDWLHKQSSTGTIAVVHVRRGDKITNKKYCPKEMRVATSPEHIAKVLRYVGLPSGSAIYIMTDETNFDHFKPLIDDYNYTVATNAHFSHLHNLVEGCQHKRGTGGLCENYLLFAIEKEIMFAVPQNFRIVTIPRHDVKHNRYFLMKDFLGQDKPCPSL